MIDFTSIYYLRYIRITIISVFFVAAIIIGIGCGLNHLNHKYLRITTNIDGLCKKEVLNIFVKDSKMCCETHFRDSTWICAASYDDKNKFMASSFAFVLPLIPLVLTSLTDVAVNWYHNSMSSSVSMKHNINVLNSLTFRVFITVMIILFRTVSILCLLTVNYSILIAIHAYIVHPVSGFGLGRKQTAGAPGARPHRRHSLLVRALHAPWNVRHVCHDDM